MTNNTFFNIMIPSAEFGMYIYLFREIRKNDQETENAAIVPMKEILQRKQKNILTLNGQTIIFAFEIALGIFAIFVIFGIARAHVFWLLPIIQACGGITHLWASPELRRFYFPCILDWMTQLSIKVSTQRNLSIPEIRDNASQASLSSVPRDHSATPRPCLSSNSRVVGHFSKVPARFSVNPYNNTSASAPTVQSVPSTHLEELRGWQRLGHPTVHQNIFFLRYHNEYARTENSQASNSTNQVNVPIEPCLPRVDC